MNDLIDKRNSNEGENDVRRDAKASSAGSTMRQASGLGRIFGGAAATRGDRGDVDGSGARSTGRRAVALLPAIVLFLLILAPAAHAGRVPGFGFLGTGEGGEGAGQLGFYPRAAAANTTGAGGVSAGDVYVSDAGNNRISEYHADGEFVRAFGLDVVASGPDNVTPASAEQAVEVPNAVTGGTFRLSFNGATTGGSATGTLTGGSTAVTNLVTATGTGTVVSGSFTISDLTTSAGQFVVGQPIAGAGIPAGAEVTSVSGSTLTISAAATAEGSEVALTSAGPLPFVVGEAISGAGIPAGTTIAAAGAGTLTLSAPVEAGHSGANVALTAGLPYDATAATVQSALTALGTIGAGNATVAGGPGATAPYTVTFAGALKEAPLPSIAADSTDLSGGTVTVSTTTPGVSPYEICDVAANPTDVCEGGTSSSTAGGISQGQGLTVDPATGNVFLVADTSKRVNVYSATGAFEGAFGWRVNATSPAEALQFCTFSTGCAAGRQGDAAGQFGLMAGAAGQGSTPVVSPINGHLFVPEPGNRRVDEFSLTLNGSHEVTGATFLKAFGGDVAPTINERQQITISGATGGNFALELDSHSTNAAGIGDIQAGSNEIANVSMTVGKFARGEEIVGPGIPAGTTISVVTFNSLTLSAAATGTSPGASISAELPYDAEAIGVRSALEALPKVGAKNVTVSGPDGGPWTVEFTGALEGESVEQLAGDSSDLDGAGPAIAVTVLQTGHGGPAARTGHLAPGPPAVPEICTVATTCKRGAEGGRDETLGVFARQTPDSVAIDSTGAIYVAGQSGENCFGTCGVLKFNPEGKSPEEFAPLQLSPPEGVSSNPNTVRWVAVDPSNDRVEVLKKTSATTFKLFEFTSAGSFVDATPAGVSGFPSTEINPGALAIGIGNRTYIPALRLIAGPPPVRIFAAVEIFSNPPAPTAVAEAPSGITRSSARLSGVASPSAGGYPTVAFFEYSSNGLTWEATEPVEIGTGAGAGSPHSCPTGNPPECSVSQTVFGLTPGQAYLARLVVSNGTATKSSPVSFETVSGAPTISGMSASEVGQTAAVISGKVNPNNRSTSYHFEWGTDTNYGHRVPANFDSVAGSGGQPVTVNVNLAGLTPNTTYHYRIVAKSNAGTTFGADSELRTLNSAGLPANRAPELVSPADKKPAGSVTSFIPTQVVFQVTEDGEQAAYPILNGTKEATAGGETIFASKRSAEGWRSAQLSPPSLIPAVDGEGTRPGAVRYLDRKHFKCAVIESFNPLTEDTPRIDVENGVVNLYLWTASDDAYTLITNRVPLNPRAEQINNAFEVAGATSDCSKLFFRMVSSSELPGYEYWPNATGLYEWDNGVLRDAGLLPDGTSGSTGPGTVGREVALNEWSVSPRGRLFFTATSDAGNDSGKRAVFVRKSPTEVVDASLSKTATPTLGARYETATQDGSHVFFEANYGLTSESSHGGSPVTCNSEGLTSQACDIYDYDVENGELIDISADSNPADVDGAVAQGVMDVSEDGSTVYFSARGQLVPGEGPTYNQNLQGSGTASLYRWHEGHLSYIGVLSAGDLSNTNQGALIREPREWVDQTDDDGEYLFFASHANMLGNNPQELTEAYLYSAGDESLNCVSCPPEGRTPQTFPDDTRVLIAKQTDEGEGFDNYHPRALSEDGRAFFTAHEALAPGAVSGQPNVYEWDEGQLSLLTTGKVAAFKDLGGPDGRDAFATSSEQLVPQDTDFAIDLYDFRSGGGIPAPPAPAPGCDPALGQCQNGGPGAPAPAQSSTATFNGAGNVTPSAPKHHKKKHHKKHRKHHKKKHHGKKHHGKKGHGKKHGGKKHGKKSHKKKAKHKKSGKAGRAASVDHGGRK